MAQKRVLIFLTAGDESDEWHASPERKPPPPFPGWGFNFDNLYALRSNDTRKPQEYRILDDLERGLKDLKCSFLCLVIWINGRNYLNNTNAAITDFITDFNKIRSQLPSDSKVLVASHGWTDLPITDAMSVVYHRGLSGYQEILLPLATVGQSEFANQFDKAWKYLLSAPRLPALKHLSHRIEHIFAPLAIDIQGILQVESHRRLEYAQKIIESYRTRGDRPFLTLLADLYFLLCRWGELQFQDQDTTLKTHLSEEALPEVRQLDGTYKRMALCGILEPQHDIDCARRIREICGLDDSWRPQVNSWLMGFLKDLEAAALENNPDELVNIITSRGKEFLDKCQALRQCFDKLETLLPEYAEPAEEGR